MSQYRCLIKIGPLILLLLLGFAAPWMATADPLAIQPRQRLQAPSADHIMGTDEFGRDVWSRTATGARTSLSIGFSVVICTILFGGFFGMITALNQRADAVIMRIFDGWMAFPEIILAIALAAVWGAGPFVIGAAMCFAYTPRLARVTRAAVLRIKNQEYIEAIRAVGASELRVVLRHMLPNALSPIIVQATYLFAAAILAEAALSFLGVGIQPPNPSWGGMISEARDYLPVAPWMALGPGAAMFLAVISLNILGDLLQDWLDPR